MEIENIATLTRIITAMITPVILILATASILGITSQRLSKALERARRMWEQLLHFPELEGHIELEEEARVHLTSLIKKVSKRARLLQKAMIILYISLSLFVGTSVAIGFIALAGSSTYWIPMAMEVGGIALLFYSTVILILEARIAVRSVKQETEFVLNIENHRHHRKPWPWENELSYKE